MSVEFIEEECCEDCGCLFDDCECDINEVDYQVCIICGCDQPLYNFVDRVDGGEQIIRDNCDSCKLDKRQKIK
jgi:hypothetical protein